MSYTLGTTGQAAMPGFANVENIVPLSSDTQVTYPPTGAGNQKNVTVTFNTSMYPDADSVRVTMRVPALYTVDGNGNVNGFDVSYAINISLNNGPFYELDAVTIQGKCTNPYLHSTTYALPKTSPASSSYSWTIVITKTDLDVLSTNTENSLYVDSIGIISSSSLNYPNSVLVGTFIDADQFSQIPNRAYLMDGLLVNVPVGYTPTSYSQNAYFTRNCFFNNDNQNINIDTYIDPNGTGLAGMAVGMPVYGPGLPAGCAITYIHNSPSPGYYFSINQPTISAESGISLTFQTNGFTPITPASYPDIWYGNFQSGVWTDNPAWIFYDLLTNSRYGLGDFIQPEWVDKWTMYQIAQYCDQLVDNGQGNSGVEPRFACNIHIQQPDDAYNVLMNFASVFRGMIYYANGTIYTTQQDDKSPVYGYTNANVIKGQFSYADSARNTRSTVAQVRWNDPTNLYRQNVAYVEDTDGILRYGYVLKELAAIGCTSPGQAYRLGQWALLAERTLTP
jgi:predicted phage tail protein